MAVQRELTPADILAILRRRWLLAVSLGIIGALVGYGVSRMLPSRFKSQTLVLIEEPLVPRDLVKPMISSDISQRLASMQEQILSRSRLDPIIRQLGLYPSEVDKVPMEDLVARLQKAIEVTPVYPMAETSPQQLPGFRVTVTLDNARTAQAVCNAVTSMFIEENLKLRQQRSEDTTQFLGQQLADAKQKLDDQDTKLAAFKSRFIGSQPDDEQTNLNLLMGLSSQLDATTESLSRAQQDKSFAESVLNQQIAAWQASQTGQNPDTLEQQLAALQNQLASLETRYTDDYPDVTKAKADIAALKKKIAESENAKRVTPEESARTTAEPPQIQQSRAQIHQYEQTIKEKTAQQQQLQNQIHVYQARVQSSPAIEQEYKGLTRDYQTASDFYNDLLKKQDESVMAAELERRQQGEQFRVMDAANLPDRPSFPNRPLFALGGFGAGLALSVAIGFLLEMKDTSFRGERDVELVLHLPVLVMIPEIHPLEGSPATNPKKLPSNGMPVETGLRA